MISNHKRLSNQRWQDTKRFNDTDRANQKKTMIYDNISTSCKLILDNFGNSPRENLSWLHFVLTFSYCGDSQYIVATHDRTARLLAIIAGKINRSAVSQ